MIHNLRLRGWIFYGSRAVFNSLGRYVLKVRHPEPLVKTPLNVPRLLSPFNAADFRFVRFRAVSGSGQMKKLKTSGCLR